ncbi:MAG: hypothetical protein RIB45_03800 [Marivibrio sp.]|uniref:hypothetical protein n=1 Tax=Marivibrio sp. TaxID=2039719 RepID=UPI0032F07353
MSAAPRSARSPSAERDPGLLDHVTRQWARAYPGVSVHTGFKRPDPRPVIRPVDVEPWPPQPPQATALERRWDDPAATGRTWERRPYGREEAPVYLTELDSRAETDASRPERTDPAGNAETGGKPGSTSHPAPRDDGGDGRFPWKLHDPDTGAPSTVDPSSGEDLGWPEKRFDPEHGTILTDPRTGEPVRDPDGAPYASAPEAQARLRERLDGLLETPPDQMTDDQLDALHEALTVQQLLFHGPPGVEGVSDRTDRFEHGDISRPRLDAPSAPQREEENEPDPELNTPEETPDDPRAPPPLVPLPDGQRPRKPAPGRRPALQPGGGDAQTAFGRRLLKWLREQGFLDGEEPSRGDKSSGRGRRGR